MDFDQTLQIGPVNTSNWLVGVPGVGSSTPLSAEVQAGNPSRVVGVVGIGGFPNPDGFVSYSDNVGLDLVGQNGLPVAPFIEFFDWS